MDAQTCLICVVLVVISGAVLFFIAMFSMQEKTYEEAIAEQRKMPNDELLFGKSSKENKNKKRKRQGKKVKEKPTSNKVVNNKKNVKKQSSSETNFKLDHKENEHSHVNFLTPEAEVLNEVNSLSHLSNKKGKEKIKPILINKKEPAAVKIKTTPKDLPVNHFIEIIPKDDLQLKLIANVNNHNLKNSQKNHTNSEENFVDKGLHVKEKSVLKSSVREINSKIENVKGKKNDSQKENKNNKINSEKFDKNNCSEETVQKAKENTLQNEKVKNKVKSERLKDDKVKNKNMNEDKSETEKVTSDKGTAEKAKDNKGTTEKIKDDKVTTDKKENNNKTEKIKNCDLKEGKAKSNKISAEKVKDDRVKVEKNKDDHIKNEKAKDNKIQNENIKIDKTKQLKGINEKSNSSDRIKNEDYKVHHQKPQFEVKQSKFELNGSPKMSNTALASTLVKKISNQQQLNNKEQRNKKTQKNELFFLEQMTERDAVNINFLLPLIRKAELSRSEVQLLTDMLLTKHLDQVSDHFEWTEGRQDPVVKLKKQLAEREKALAEEQEASQAFQNKLKELRSEYNSERTRLTQACRQYDETILAKQGEIQNLHATNRHLVDSHVAEKQALTQKIQQLQAQINDETLMIRKLQEDHNQTQNALQQELQELVNQRQQMEIHIGRLREQLQEAQKNFEAQIHSLMQENEQVRASFNAELQKNRRHEEELRELREQQVQNQNKIKSLESWKTVASQLQETSNHTQELLRQVEELQQANKDLEIRYNSSQQLEEELKFKNTKLQNEVHCITNKISEFQSDCDKLRKEREKLAGQMGAQIELEKDYLRIKEENQFLISQVASFSKIEREAQRLREENENLAAQVTAFTERPAADGRENGDSPYNEEKKHDANAEFISHENEKQKDVVIERLADELNQKEILVKNLKSQLQESESEITRLSSEIAKYKTEIPKLREEIEAQRNKNNDLRKKNWKAMEALAATEKTLENNLRETEKSTQIRLEQDQNAFKHLLERIFPFIKINEKNFENWLVEFENSAKNYLEEIKSDREKLSQFDLAHVEELENKNSQLQTFVVHYKKIIEDTEGMLNKLQNHVEQEEIRWRQQFETQETRIKMLTDGLAVVKNTNEKLESKVKESVNKDGGDTDCIGQGDNELATLESEKCKKLLNEIEIIKSKLTGEEEKNKELNKEVVKLRSTIKFGQDAYVEENKRRLELEDELKLLKSENIRDVPINSSGDFVAYEKDGFERQ